MTGDENEPNSDGEENPLFVGSVRVPSRGPDMAQLKKTYLASQSSKSPSERSANSPRTSQKGGSKSPIRKSLTRSPSHHHSQPGLDTIYKMQKHAMGEMLGRRGVPTPGSSALPPVPQLHPANDDQDNDDDDDEVQEVPKTPTREEWAARTPSSRTPGGTRKRRVQDLVSSFSTMIGTTLTTKQTEENQKTSPGSKKPKTEPERNFIVKSETIEILDSDDEIDTVS